MSILNRLYEEASVGGSLSDLGEPPAMGVTSSSNVGGKRLKKNFIPTRSVSESEDIGDEDLSPEETVETGDGPEAAPVYGKDTPGAVDPGADPGAMDQKTAQSILDAPIEMKKEEEEEEEGPPKAQMQRVLQFLVSKPTRNTHLKSSGHVDISKPWMVKGQLQIGENLTSRIFREAVVKNTTKDAKSKLVVGIITKTRDRYIFTTDVLAGGSDRNFVFEGDRVKMKALLTILKATMRDFGGGADSILNEVDTRVSPVEIVMSRDLLLTDGVEYVEQIVVQ